MIRKGFIIEGLKCEGCPEIIKKQALSVAGVSHVEFDGKKRVGYATFDPSRTNIDEILFKIEEKGYKGFILAEKNPIVRQKFIADGLKCEGCPEIIRKQAISVEGVKEAGFDYDTGEGIVVFDSQKTDIDTIFTKIGEKGYKCYVKEQKHYADNEKNVARSNETGNITKVAFSASGTTCDSCAEIIKRQAMKVEGVREAEFDLRSGTGYVVFDKNKTKIDDIFHKIERKGYVCSLTGTGKKKSPIGWIISALGILILGYYLFGFIEGINLPQISAGMGLGLIFAVGLLTGFHCIAMCGGFVVGYTAKDAQEGRKSNKSHMMYAMGKVTSYTVIGAAFGLVGSIIAFTPAMRGVAGIASGLFLVLFGLKMLNIIPSLRGFHLQTPKSVSKFVDNKKKTSSSPLVLGLLNGLMIACGPLQAIYIMAAGTGSMIEGGKMLFVFALGTLPVMLGFGYFASFISGKMTNKILKASGAIVIVLGAIMINNGLLLTGSGYDIGSLVSASSSTDLGTAGVSPKDTPVLNEGYQEIRMTVDRSGFSPNKFVLQKGVPVKWIITGKELNGCNNAIQVPAYNLKFDVKQGEQIIEFTPDKEGTIRWSCWMGMIPGTFIVKDSIDVSNQAAVQKELDAVPTPKGGSCGMGGGGGCGCGGGR